MLATVSLNSNINLQIFLGFTSSSICLFTFEHPVDSYWFHKDGLNSFYTEHILVPIFVSNFANKLLQALDWSPDQELVVLVTKDLNTILMSCMFDPIHEVNLLSQEFGDKQFITVGWGKKETQFHGSEGKQARAKSEISAGKVVD